jgi:hypothetical protein
MNARFRPQPRTQRGFTLIVAILLLLILTIFSLSALNVGVFEQRTSANDYRAKVVHQVAEVGLNHASEALRVLKTQITPGAGVGVNVALWERCQANDTSFPCGAEPDATRRGSSYRYIGGVDLDGDGAVSTLERRSINFPVTYEAGAARRLLQTTVPSADPANPFTVEYAVGALLCRIDLQANPGAGDNPCTTSIARASRLNAVTLVSRAEMVGESATATVSRAIVPIQRIGINPKTPAITASGVMQGVGNATIVGNPNSGGPGVPISIWSRADFDGDNGTWQTCHIDDWLRNSVIEIYEGIPVCDGNPSDCTCPGDAILSTGGAGGITEGLDVLDIDNNFGTLRDSQEFPCDLMEFVFGEVRAREDTDGDGFCEDGTDSDGDGDNDAVVDFIRGQLQATEIDDCSDVATELGPSSSGAYWVSADGCSLPGTDVGSPENPVIIIMDGGIDFATKMRVFGLVFGRDPALDLNPATGGSARWAPGGGTGFIYGAAVLEGGGRSNGRISVIYNADVLGSGNQAGDPVAGEIPGSWTDRYSY